MKTHVFAFMILLPLAASATAGRPPLRQCHAAWYVEQLGWIDLLAGDRQALESATEAAVADFRRRFEAAARRKLAERAPGVGIRRFEFSEVPRQQRRKVAIAFSALDFNAGRLQRALADGWWPVAIDDFSFDRALQIRVSLDDGTRLAGNLMVESGREAQALVRLPESVSDDGVLPSGAPAGVGAELLAERRTEFRGGCRSQPLARSFCLYREQDPGRDADAAELVRLEAPWDLDGSYLHSALNRSESARGFYRPYTPSDPYEKGFPCDPAYPVHK